MPNEMSNEIEPVAQCTDADPRELFVRWMVTPPTQRRPRTQSQLAKLLGVAESTLSRWKNDPALCESLPERARQRALMHASDILDVLAKKARKGSLYAVELYLKFVLRLREARDVPAPVDNRVQILIGGKPADSLPVGLIRPTQTTIPN